MSPRGVRNFSAARGGAGEQQAADGAARLLCNSSGRAGWESLLGNLCQALCSHTSSHSLAPVLFLELNLTSFLTGIQNLPALCSGKGLLHEQLGPVGMSQLPKSQIIKSPNASDTSLSLSACGNGLGGFHPWLPGECGTPQLWGYVIFLLMLLETSVDLLNLQSVEESWCAEQRG